MSISTRLQPRLLPIVGQAVERKSVGCAERRCVLGRRSPLCEIACMPNLVALYVRFFGTTSRGKERRVLKARSVTRLLLVGSRPRVSVGFVGRRVLF